MAKEKMTTEVLCQEKLAEGIYSLWLNAGKMAAEAEIGRAHV